MRRGVAMKLGIGLLILAAIASPLEARDLCPDRPGLDTPACTVDPGRLVLETGIGDWTLDKTASQRTDTLTLGDALLRIGVAEHAEIQIGWTAFGHARTRDRLTGAVSRDSGGGDVTLAVKRNLANPDGSGFSAALLPYVTLPAGGQAIGAGTWGAGMILPLSYALTDKLSLSATPEIDAAPDGDRSGRHLRYGSVGGLGMKLSGSVQASAELSLFRDRDPDDRATEALAGLSIGWQPGKEWQLDLGVNAGLNHASPDVEVYGGVVRRF